MTASKDRLRLWLRLLKLTRFIETDLRERFRAEFATTLPRFDVMAALSRYDAGLRMSELSAVLRVSGGNITGIVDRLEQDGLAERVAVPGDRRAMRVQLTSAGHIAFKAQAEAHEAWINSLFADMTGEDARALVRQLSTVLEEQELIHAG